MKERSSEERRTGIRVIFITSPSIGKEYSDRIEERQTGEAGLNLFGEETGASVELSCGSYRIYPPSFSSPSSSIFLPFARLLSILLSLSLSLSLTFSSPPSVSVGVQTRRSVQSTQYRAARVYGVSCRLTTGKPPVADEGNGTMKRSCWRVVG